MASAELTTSFGYRAQTEGGDAVAGTIEAADVREAGKKLEGLRLRILELSPVEPPRAKALRGDDFLAFNQQLSHLTKAGLPVEQGLRLMAQEMRSGRLAETVRQVAEELEKGRPLGEAFEQYRGRFPALYGKLIDAGVRTGNLPGMLMNIGRHLEMVQRLRASLWRAAAYPMMVIVALIFVLGFLCVFVVPKFEAIFADFGMRLPTVTQWLLEFSRAAPTLLIVALLVIVAIPILWGMLRASGNDRWVIDRLVLPIPVLGGVLKRNFLARWCDAAKLGVAAGMDLPTAISVAGEVVGSPALEADSRELVDSLARGGAINEEMRGRILPPSIPAVIAMAGERNELPEALGTLSQMYQQQADLRLSTVPVVAAPVLIMLIALVVGFVILGLFAPLITLIQAISGPG